MDFTTAERLTRMRDAQCSMRTMLGYSECAGAGDSCPVCGARLYEGTAMYESDDGEVLGCAACINVRYA